MIKYGDMPFPDSLCPICSSCGDRITDEYYIVTNVGLNELCFHESCVETARVDDYIEGNMLAAVDEEIDRRMS